MAFLVVMLVGRVQIQPKKKTDNPAMKKPTLGKSLKTNFRGNKPQITVSEYFYNH